jgi:hypothetical protein
MKCLLPWYNSLQITSIPHSSSLLTPSVSSKESSISLSTTKKLATSSSSAPLLMENALSASPTTYLTRILVVSHGGAIIELLNNINKYGKSQESSQLLLFLPQFNSFEVSLFNVLSSSSPKPCNSSGNCCLHILCLSNIKQLTKSSVETIFTYNYFKLASNLKLYDL